MLAMTCKRLLQNAAQSTECANLVKSVAFGIAIHHSRTDHHNQTFWQIQYNLTIEYPTTNVYVYINVCIIINITTIIISCICLCSYILHPWHYTHS